MRQNRPIPYWIRMRTDNTIRSIHFFVIFHNSNFLIIHLTFLSLWILSGTMQNAGIGVVPSLAFEVLVIIIIHNIFHSYLCNYFCSFRLEWGFIFFWFNNSNFGGDTLFWLFIYKQNCFYTIALLCFLDTFIWNL